MNTSAIQSALEDYQNTLDKLDISNKSLSQEEIIDILLTREAIEKLLSSQIKSSVYVILKIQELDSKLKENAEKLIKVIDLTEYRQNFPQSSDAWWWCLDIYYQEKTRKSHPWNRFDWLLKGIRVIVWTGNLALLGSIAVLFLRGSSGFWGVVTIAFPSILSLLQAKSELTETGQKAFDRFLEKLKIPQYLHEESKLISNLLITVFLVSIWFSLPLISNLYKKQGLQHQDNEKLALAEQKYLKAIELDADNLDAYYKLGILYEELQDLDSAKKQYIIAAKGGFLDAYNNLSYLYIRENKDAEAAQLLDKAKALLAEKDKKSEQLSENEKLNLQIQKYSIYKNLGWARFEQNRNEDTNIYLSTAKSIADNKDYQKYIRNPGAVFCIYAKLLQKEDKDKQTISVEAKENWRKCWELSQGKELTIEEEQWLYEAQKKLNLK